METPPFHVRRSGGPVVVFRPDSQFSTSQPSVRHPSGRYAGTNDGYVDNIRHRGVVGRTFELYATLRVSPQQKALGRSRNASLFRKV